MNKCVQIFLAFILCFACAPTASEAPPQDPIEIKEDKAPNKKFQVHWHEFNRKTVLQAVERDRLIILYIYADWCPYCQKMDETTFGDPKVVGLLNRFFVSAKVDGDERPDVFAAFTDGIGYYPTTVVLYPHLKQKRIIHLGIHHGYIGPEAYSKMLLFLLSKKSNYTASF